MFLNLAVNFMPDRRLSEGATDSQTKMIIDVFNEIDRTLLHNTIMNPETVVEGIIHLCVETRPINSDSPIVAREFLTDLFGELPRRFPVVEGDNLSQSRQLPSKDASIDQRPLCFLVDADYDDRQASTSILEAVSHERPHAGTTEKGGSTIHRLAHAGST